jgi:hypothetical protein
MLTHNISVLPLLICRLVVDISLFAFICIGAQESFEHKYSRFGYVNLYNIFEETNQNDCSHKEKEMLKRKSR